jgi:signal transduction histidine kinase
MRTALEYKSESASASIGMHQPAARCCPAQRSGRCFPASRTHEVRKAVASERNEIERLNRRLRSLTAGLLRSPDPEKRRIARELHDDTARLMAAISLNLQRVLQTEGTHHRQLIGEALSVAQQCSRQIRALSFQAAGSATGRVRPCFPPCVSI